MKIAWKQNWLLCLIIAMVIIAVVKDSIAAMNTISPSANNDPPTDHWIAPSLYLNNTEGFDRQQLIYGEDLIANTSHYFGPNGTVAKISNGMNCQNCHLQAGTQYKGNNYGAVFSLYPKFRERSGTVESISKRVNDCFLRSLNGEAIDSSSKEMKAIVAYISWLGKDVQHGVKPAGTGISDVAYLDRAANSANGAELYITQCKRCHGENGEGLINPNNTGYTYPPLWGMHSYNTGAGLFRLSRLAGFIKYNMPFDLATPGQAMLSDADAWDLAAFINAQTRPQKIFSTDWPDISKKPVDYPFGPYSDGFSEAQHKFGPFAEMVALRKR